MKVDSGLFTGPEPDSPPGFVLRLDVEGSGFEHRATPFVARVGSVPLEELFMTPDGSGFSGFLAQMPNDGDRLFIGYGGEPQLPTSVVFGPALVA